MTLSPEIRNFIMTKLAEGMAKVDIAKIYNASLRTVYGIFNRNASKPKSKRFQQKRTSKELIIRAIKALHHTKQRCHALKNAVTIIQ